MDDAGELAGRTYKSRKSRPCDACRRRKVTCVMPSGPPCHRCSGKALSCTFEHGPGERKRPAPEQPSAASQSRHRLSAVALSSASPPARSPNRPDTALPAVLPPMWMTDPAFYPDQLNRSWGLSDSFDVSPGGPDRMDTGNAQPALHWETVGLRPMQPMHHVFPATPSLDLPHSWREPSQPQAQSQPQRQPQPPQQQSLPAPPFTTPSPRSTNISATAPRNDNDVALAAVTGSPYNIPFSTSGSLDILPGAFSFYIGPTGVSDIHLLNKESFGADGVTELSVKGLKYRRMQSARGRQRTRTRGRRLEQCSASPEQDDEESLPVIFGLTDRALLDKAEPKPDAEATESAWVALWKILTPQTAWSLVHLYARFVDPYFPILARHQMPQDPNELSNVPLALLTAICATALPFVIYDRSLYALLLRPPNSEELYRLCWQGISQELHTPSLSTVQACLLLQQRLPTNLYLNDTAFSWSLMATAVSVAHTIGLHRDPSDWTTVPAWERRLRRRLWWALWATEKWMALARGMPSHFSDDEADVEPMRLDDIRETLSDTETPHPHLYCLVSLTLILAEIQKTFYTVRATRQTQRNLALSLELGRATRVRLKAWHDSLPDRLQQSRNRKMPNQSVVSDKPSVHSSSSGGEDQGRAGDSDGQQLDGNASLHLSYIVTHMTLFRALLRPLENDDQHTHAASDGDSSNACLGCDSQDSGPGTQAVMRGALLCIREFVGFVELLTPTQWNAFWHGWSRANFAIAGSFMVQLLHIVSAAPLRPAAKNKTGSSGGADMDADTDSDVSVGSSGGRDAKAKDGSGPTPRPGFVDEYRELAGWIKRWRWASRVSATGAAGAKGLTNLGLLRVETFIGQMGGLDDV